MYHPDENNYFDDKLSVYIEKVKVPTQDGLDLLGWERYLKNARNKDLADKASQWGLEVKVQKLKMAQIADTITALEELSPENLDEVYGAIANVWA